MKLLLISYSKLEYDGRLQRLISVFSKVGDLQIFIQGHKDSTKYGNFLHLSYFSFIVNAVKYARKLGTVDLLILDNQLTAIPGLLLKVLLHPTYVIQDCRELSLFDETKGLTGKVLCAFERLVSQKADIVICANNDRAVIMKKSFSLAKQPLVYTNIRQLDYTTLEEKEKVQHKFSTLLKEDEYRIISLSGCSIKRKNDILVKNLKNVNKKCRLFLAGINTSSEEKMIKDLAALDTKNSVSILGLLNQSELKYLVSHCHIGIVNYGQYDMNNKYCASGKLYEYLFEGIPVVTTTNPPLKKICDEECVGVADDEFADGINEVLDNYDKFKKNVKLYTSRITVKDNDDYLVCEINNLLHK